MAQATAVKDFEHASNDARRGIRNVQALYDDRTVQGSFDDISLAGRAANDSIYNEPREGVPEEELESEEASYIEERAERLRQNRADTQKRNRDLDINLSYDKKMQGPMFWFVVMLALFKDVLDFIFSLTVFFSFFSTIFAVIIGGVILFYLKYNDVSFTTRKAVATTISLLIEFIPIISFLPMATINLFLVRYYENNERLAKLISKRKWSVLKA